MTTNSKEKPTVQQPQPRTYLISSVQLTEIMRYLMTRPYGEVVKLMNMIATLNQTIRDLKEIYDKEGKFNTYLLNEDFIEDKYYQFRGY